MAGGLMQLVAYGAQDVYLTGNPQITFFKVVYRRHTNFATESIQQTFTGTANFGRKVSCQVQRNGDLITKTYLQVILPGYDTGDSEAKWAWVPKVGHALINSVELFIGGTSIDKHYGDWLNVWYEVARKFQQDRGYDHLIGNNADLVTLAQSHTQSTLYIPLQFFFNRFDGLALPLIALQYHDVRIDIEFNPLSNLIIQNAYSAVGNKVGNLSFVDASIYIDYVYLDNDERKRFAQATHEYLIEQLQFTGDESVTNTNNKYRLNFNHPVKALYWVVRLNKYTSAQPYLAWHPTDSLALQLEATRRFVLRYARYTSNGNDLVPGSNNSVILDSGYSGAIQALWARIDPYFTSVEPLTQNIVVNEYLTIEELSRPTTYWDNFLNVTAPPGTHGSPEYDIRVIATDRYGAYLDGSLNPVSQVLIQLNGHDRFTIRDGNYFNYVQPWQTHTNTPRDGVNVYSFALNPEDHQPSGTCNMSRIDNAQLNVVVSSGYVPTSNDVGGATSYQNAYIGTDSRLSVYATNYNVLRIMSGMGGLAYSN